MTDEEKKDDLDELDEDEGEEEADSDDSDDSDADSDDSDADSDDSAADSDDSDSDDADSDSDADADSDSDDSDAEADSDDSDADSDADADSDSDDADADDGRAAEVARALGLDDDDGEGDDEAGGDDEEAKLNRAERRRRRAQRRRRRKAGKAGGDADEPKDRNKKKRDELIARRRRVAEAEDEDELPQQGLLPSEMVDDALARGGDAAIKWVRNNWSWVQWVLAAALFGSIGFVTWRHFSQQSVEQTSDALAAGVLAEEATIISPDEDDRTEEQKKQDIRVVYPSREEQQQAALASYREAAQGDGGAALLAKLGEAGVLLDRGEWDAAVAAFDAVLASPLAAADTDVKGRALEGKGFALESKKDLDGALAAFTSMAELNDDFFKTLSLYHQGRIQVAKGDKDKGTELLKEARKIADKAKVDARLVANVHPYRWLDKAIDDVLREIDPKLALPTPGGDAPMRLSPEQLQQKLKEKGLSPEMPGLPQ